MPVSLLIDRAATIEDPKVLDEIDEAIKEKGVGG